MHVRLLPLVLLAAHLPAAASDPAWPAKPVRIVIGFGAGTAVDTQARLLGGRFAQLWEQPVTIEPVVGAAGNLAAERVAKAAADGHTLLWSGNAAMVVNPSLYAKLGYDPLRDFQPISQVVVTPNVLVVHPSVPAREVRELVALARARPGDLTYASAGVGTSQHIAGELMRTMAGASFTHVPYKGGQGMLPDLLSGRVAMSFVNIAGAAVPMMREGRLRGLAVTSLRRTALLPELPTIAESGLPGFESVAWFGLLAPAATPAAVVQRVHASVVEALQSPEIRSRYRDLGLEIVADTPARFGTVIREELPKWAKLIREAGIRAE